MLSGLIVYNKIDQEKNAWFINQCKERFAKKGISLFYKEENEVLDYIANNQVDFVLYRARNYKIVESLESNGVKCFNNSLTNKVANNKYLTYQFLKEKNIPCLVSYTHFEEVNSLPVIMKSVDGHGGQEVFLVNSKKEAEQTTNNLKKEMIYQEYYPNGDDLRLYVLDKKVIGAVKRHSGSDFRSNFSLGGDVEAFEPDAELIKIAIEVANSLDADYIGVDFIKVNDKWCINEVEDPVGARMLYKTTGLDVIDLLVDYIASSLIVIN